MTLEEELERGEKLNRLTHRGGEREEMRKTMVRW